MTEINGYTKPLCILGSPVSHSLSPAMYNRLFQKLDLNLIYLAFDIKQKDLKEVVKSLVKLGFIGGNITYPLKKSFYQLCDKTIFPANLLQAVNCFEIKNGEIIGYNTDGEGFVDSLKDRGINLKEKTVTLVGAGGAGKSITANLIDQGLNKLYIKGREKNPPHLWKETLQKEVIKKGKTLEIEVPTEDRMKKVLGETDLLINATPIGMKKGESPIDDLSYLKKTAVVHDIIYHPKETSLLREGAQKGHKTINGLSMLYGQGARCFEIWTGKKISIRDMENES